MPAQCQRPSRPRSDVRFAKRSGKCSSPPPESVGDLRLSVMRQSMSGRWLRDASESRRTSGRLFGREHRVTTEVQVDQLPDLHREVSMPMLYQWLFVPFSPRLAPAQGQAPEKPELAAQGGCGRDAERPAEWSQHTGCNCSQSVGEGGAVHAFLSPWWANSTLSMTTCELAASRSDTDHFTGNAPSACQRQTSTPA